MAEYRIDELARLANTTVRNARVYQDRGLLPPPRREGRVGIYTEVHLARLRLIGQLLKRGYTFANIAELVTVWERGGDLSEVLGFEAAVGDPWSDEIPGYITLDELEELFGEQTTPRTVARAVELGLIEPEGKRYRVPSPRLLHAGVELVAIGMPLDAVLDIAQGLRDRIDVAAGELTRRVSEHIIAASAPEGILHSEDLGEVADVIRRVRPLAQVAVDSILAQAMSRHMHETLGDHFAAIIDHLREQGERRSA